ncbi:MAG: sugar isomerase, partial [Betaproteobacteria bacterium]
MHATRFFEEVAQVAKSIDVNMVEALVLELAALRERGGRLFLLGVGGSAGNCSHAVNDFRKLCGIEAYTPVDNVSELTARANDEGWETIFSAWLKVSKANAKDAILVFSVGGGNAEKNVSVNIVSGLK